LRDWSIALYVLAERADNRATPAFRDALLWAANRHGDIFEDAGHVIWILGNGGLTKFSHGRFVTLTHEQRLPASVLGAIVGDGYDELWLNTDSGLLLLSRKAFDAAVKDPCRRLQYQLYDTADGVAGAPIVKLLARRDANGRLWFARGGALTSVTPTPSHLAGTLRPQLRSVLIEGVVTDDGAVRDLSNSVLSSSTRRIEINYTALALTAPAKIRFRYRLDGFDRLGRRRNRRQASTRICTGPTSFASSQRNDGRWGTAAAGMALSA
jgi:hypothetical protein